tara:strand:- start:1109 stop:1222 length:114 start_codon:yes stop_codon:yes gene_type:complete
MEDIGLETTVFHWFISLDKSIALACQEIIKYNFALAF